MTDIAAATGPVAFVGRRRPLFWLLIKNGLLTILTVGIYRFWAKTHLRRYYWNNIAVAGDRLEYLGRPIELLIGFLIAIAVLVPLGIATSALGLALAAAWPGLEIAGNILFVLALVWLGNFAIYRVRRYRMTRTSWRGIRAGQTGSAVRYAFLRFGLAIVSLLTLGFAYPWGRVVLHRYVIGHTRFGNAGFGFTGTVRQLFRLWLPVQILFLLFIGALAAAFGTFVDFAGQLADLEALLLEGDLSIEDFNAAAEAATVGLIAGAWFIVPAYLLFILGFLWFRVAELRYIFNSMNLAAATSRSSFPFRSLLWRGVLLWLAFMAVAVLIGIAFGLSSLAGIASPALAFVVGLVLILPISLTLFTLQHLVFWMPLLRTFCARLSVDNVAELERIAQSTEQDPRYGEGLADALSIDALPV